MNTKITFIGAGNMASGMVGGLIQHGWPAHHLTAADIDVRKLDQLKQQYEIETTTDNTQAIHQAGVVIFAVKPPIMRLAAKTLAPALTAQKPLIMSIAAGIQTNHIGQWLGSALSIVRCMPNMPALVQLGATGLYANAQTTDDEKALAQSITDAIGLSVWVDTERELDLVTALSGSGPAYFFLFMEALEQAAQSLGLSSDAAHQLTLQTALGAVTMATEATDSLATLRKNVTSPGGTTEKAILSFENTQFRQHIATAVNAAYQRSMELSQQFGQDE